MTIDDIIRSIVEEVASVQNDYSSIRTVDDAKRYYEKNFPGTTRNELSEDHETGGRGFYMFLYRRDWCDAVLPVSKNAAHRDYSSLETIADARKYCQETFSGMIRKDIQLDSKNGGSGFYDFLVRKGWRDEVLPQGKLIERRKHAKSKGYGTLKTANDAKRYCEKNFPGMSRREIQRDLANCGGGFYDFLVRKGWRDEVLPESRCRNYSGLQTVDDAKRYYEKRFSGMTRGQLAVDREHGGSGFYGYLGRMGWRDDVLPENKRCDYSSIGNVENARLYYEQNFKGMTRGQLSKDVKGGGKRFYLYIYRKDWLDGVLPTKGGRR